MTNAAAESGAPSVPAAGLAASPPLHARSPRRPRRFEDGVRRHLGRALARRFGDAVVRRTFAAVRRAGFPNAGDVFSYTTPEELSALYDLARRVPEGGRIAEFGSHLGASAMFLLAGSAAAGAELVAVDTWNNDTMPEGERDTFDEFHRNISGGADRVRCVRKPTAEVSPEDVGPADLIFVDADHSYEAVSRDFPLSAAALAERGVIAFHDSVGFAGVTRVIGEALATGEWVLAGTAGSLFWLHRRADLGGAAADPNRKVGGPVD